MATDQLNRVIQHLRHVTLHRDATDLTDGELLGRFVEQHDEAAVAALVRRHAPMVWGVCRRILGHHQDVEDAFQATFLVLIRRAASVSPRDLLANWLYGVAHQTALKARAMVAKRFTREKQMPEMPDRSSPGDPSDDLQPLLDEELGRLPEKYRAVIVLCDLEGKTRKQAARYLRCPAGTVASRLASARTMLASRLARRGVVFSSGALAIALSHNACSATVPIALLASAAENATSTLVSANVASLTEGVLTAMFISKLKGTLLASIFLALFAIVVAGELFTHVIAAAQFGPSGVQSRIRESETNLKRPTSLQSGATNAPIVQANDLDSLQGGWQAQSATFDGNAMNAEEAKKTRVSIKGAKMLLIPGGEWTPVDIKLDTTTTPKRLFMTAKDVNGKTKTVTVIYRLNKKSDELTLCWDARNGKRAATEFASPKNSGLIVIVLRHDTRPPPPELKKGNAVP